METIKKIEAYGFECEAGPLGNCQDWLKLKDQHEKLIWLGEASSTSSNPELQKYLDGLKSKRDAAISNLVDHLWESHPSIDLRDKAKLDAEVRAFFN